MSWIDEQKTKEKSSWDESTTKAKSKAGRKKMADEDKRTERCVFLANKDEYETLGNAAKERGMTLSAFLRFSALSEASK